MHVMTGSWLIVKWIGISIDASYVLLLLVVYVRFVGHPSRLRGSVMLPAAFGVFVSASVPSIFGGVLMARVCFIATSAIYLAGIVILLSGLAQTNHESLLREG